MPKTVSSYFNDLRLNSAILQGFPQLKQAYKGPLKFWYGWWREGNADFVGGVGDMDLSQYMGGGPILGL